MDRLRQLHQAGRDPREDAFPKSLEPGPQIAKIAAAMQEQCSVRYGLVQGIAVEVSLVANVSGRRTEDDVEIRDLSEPDGTITDVRVIGKVEQRKGPDESTYRDKISALMFLSVAIKEVCVASTSDLSLFILSTVPDTESDKHIQGHQNQSAADHRADPAATHSRQDRVRADTVR